MSLSRTFLAERQNTRSEWYSRREPIWVSRLESTDKSDAVRSDDNERVRASMRRENRCDGGQAENQPRQDGRTPVARDGPELLEAKERYRGERQSHV